MKPLSQIRASKQRYFAWRDGKNGPEIPLPQYDVSDVPPNMLKSITYQPRLRVPGYMRSIRSLEGSNNGQKRFVIRLEGSVKIAVALDPDIVRLLVEAGAKPLKRAYLLPMC